MTHITSLAAMVFLAVSLSCGGGRSYSGDPPDACLDMADVVADALARCGQDYQANYDGFIDGAANGDCNNIKAVRDADALYDDCFAWFDSSECSKVTDPDETPNTCNNQLLR